MTYVLGLTGSIGMGKSTTAAILQQYGVPVWDADGAVHRLYGAGGAAVAPIADLCPQALVAGGLDRGKLRERVLADASLLPKIQSIVHPLVAADRADFIARAHDEIIALDIPLLFEIGAEAVCDGVIVVTAAADVQKARVLARGLSEADFDMLNARQMPDAEKRARATWVVETLTVGHVSTAIGQILAQIQVQIRGGAFDA
jgi:dephospho-CoA kinase